MMGVAAHQLGVDLPVRFTATQPLDFRGMPEIRPPEHFAQQEGERVRRGRLRGLRAGGRPGAQPAVQATRQQEARGTRTAAGLHGLEQQLQLPLLQFLEHRVRECLQICLSAPGRAGAGSLGVGMVVTFGTADRLAQAAASPTGTANGPMSPSVRRPFSPQFASSSASSRALLLVLAAGRTAPPETPDERRSFGPEHAGRGGEEKSRLPAKERT